VSKHSWGRTSLQKHVAIFSSLPKGIVGGGTGRAGVGAPFPVLSPQQTVGTAEADKCVELRVVRQMICLTDLERKKVAGDSQFAPTKRLCVLS